MPRVTGLLFGREGRSRPSLCVLVYGRKSVCVSVRNDIACLRGQMRTTAGKRHPFSPSLLLGTLCPPMRLVLASPSGYETLEPSLAPRNLSGGGLVTSAQSVRVSNRGRVLSRYPGPGLSAGVYLCGVRMVTPPLAYVRVVAGYKYCNWKVDFAQPRAPERIDNSPAEGWPGTAMASARPDRPTADAEHCRPQQDRGPGTTAHGLACRSAERFLEQVGYIS